MATPRSLAASITSWSRIEPPGWATQVAPASTTTSRPSRKGKKASLATTVFCSESWAASALMLAMRAESRRDIRPAPAPMVMPFLQKTMALLLTNLATFQANSRSLQLCGVGLLDGDDLQVGQGQLVVVSGLQQQAGAHALGFDGVAALLPVGFAALRAGRSSSGAH